MSQLSTEPEITGKDTILFTQGACHVLANEVHKLTGWPIYCFVEHDDPDHHAFVVPRRGWRLDVKGLTTAQEHSQHWGYRADRGQRKFTYEEILNVWGTVSAEEYAIKRAQEIAPLLVGSVTEAASRSTGKTKPHKITTSKGQQVPRLSKSEWQDD